MGEKTRSPLGISYVLSDRQTKPRRLRQEDKDKDFFRSQQAIQTLPAMGHLFSSEAGQAREGNDNGPRKRDDEFGTSHGRSAEDLAAGRPNPREDQKRYKHKVH